ncbi:MAG TPA: arginase family protein [Jatrophihabitantaceae bacterium]|nr:arginase family protein [Jatrophihabitantaceae bacterium]
MSRSSACPAAIGRTQRPFRSRCGHPRRTGRRRHTSFRARARFGPQYIRQSCYLPQDGSRPALRVDALRDLSVLDAGDVEMYSGDAARSVLDLQAAVYGVARHGGCR